MYSLAAYMYARLDEMTANYPDEKWNTTMKLRNATNDSMFYIAQATGSYLEEGAEHEWNSGRKNVFAMRSLYVFASKQKFIDIEPAIVVRIDTLITEVDKKIARSQQVTQEKIKTDLEPWLEKYRLWQAMNDGHDPAVR